MKVDKETVAAHREQIVAAASRRFREHGFDGISVADIMNEVGLTHGGFYRHFASKDELAAVAAQRAIAETIEKWRKIAEEAPADRLEAIVSSYLSRRHHDHPETGCLFAALGGELSRQPSLVKEVVEEGQRQCIDFLSGLAPGKTRALRRKQAIAALASMVGGMILARGCSDAAFQKEVLEDVAQAIVSNGH